MIECCDNLSFLEQQDQASVDLIYIDPPFNTGCRQSGADLGSSYPDQWSPEAYLELLRPRLSHMSRVLKPSGTLYIHLDWRSVHHVRLLLDQVLGTENFLNEIIWHYRTGGLSKHWFGRKHDNILAYAKRKGQHTFNVQREGEFRTDGMNYDADGRPYKSTRKGRLYFNDQGPAMTDVWDIPFLSTVSLERTGYPTQKPEALLRRIVTASSNPGDVVADYFCGCGTTLKVARDLERRYVGCDINPQAVEIARARLTSRAPGDGSQTALLF